MGLDIPLMMGTCSELRFSPLINIAMRLEGLPTDKQPSACIGCGACVQMCPQKIDIPGVMAELNETLSKIPKWGDICKQREGCGYTGTVLCAPLEFALITEGEDAPFSLTLCPICGEYADGARFALIEDATAAPLEGHTLSLVSADGTETALTVETDGESASFVLDFTDVAIPAMLIRLLLTA